MTRRARQLLIAFFIGGSLLLWASQYNQSDKTVAVSSPSPSAAQIPTPSLNPSPVPEVAGAQTGTTEAVVTRVVDGDTVELSTGQKIRYIGIDTPETVKPGTEEQCGGKQASARNKELVEGKTVKLQKDVSETDHFGRLLRYVYVDAVLINQLLAEEGLARAHAYKPDVSYQERLEQAEVKAKAAQKGIWGSLCQQEADATCVVKGNINGDGEKIYHTAECANYKRTLINTSQGEKCFQTEAEAREAGWQKAENC